MNKSEERKKRIRSALINHMKDVVNLIADVDRYKLSSDEDLEMLSEDVEKTKYWLNEVSDFVRAAMVPND
jgi:hypothetical protein